MATSKEQIDLNLADKLANLNNGSITLGGSLTQQSQGTMTLPLTTQYSGTVSIASGATLKTADGRTFTGPQEVTVESLLNNKPK